MNAKTNDAVDALGLALLRELHAICWFCDAGVDGKHALVPSDRRRWYEPDGPMADLTALGCVRLLKRSYCATVKQHRPALRMEQFGRNVLLRAEAMGIDLDSYPETEPECE